MNHEPKPYYLYPMLYGKVRAYRFNGIQQAYNRNKMTLKELKKELKNMTIPNQLTIGAKNFNNVQKTIDSHIRYLESNKGNKAFMPYWYNLLEIYEFVKEKNK